MWLFSRDPTKDFPFEVGEVIPGLENTSIWKIHQGKRKANNEQVSIFVFETKPGNESDLEVAKGSLKRIKTLRHPNVVQYLDSLESDKLLYLVTEYVEPLKHHLNASAANSKQMSLEISWGLHQIAKGLSFFHNDCNLSHNNVNISSIFVDKAGQWKIGGFDYMSADDYFPYKTLQELHKYNPPESNDRGKQVKNKWACDSWGYGCLIWESFNGPLAKTSSLKSPGKIPKNLQSIYCECVCADQASRPNLADVTLKKSGSSYFNTSFVKAMLFLEEIQIKENAEKQRFFSNLASSLDDYPPQICRYKILPQLLNAFEFGNAGSTILGPLFKLSKLLDEEEYQKSIVPCVVKLFSLKDRATRVKLLQQTESLVDHLKNNTVNDAIFPQIVQGFNDTNPKIREETVKSILYLAAKLNYNNLNVELMKHFARIQSKDDQGGIRTNTTVCLGKIANYLHPQTRQKVLVPAFCRAMKDPFAPAKIAGILALSACQGFFTLNDSAFKVLPALCFVTRDPDKNVRVQAFKTINGYLSKLEKVSEDPSLAEEMEAAVNAGASSGITGSAASWAGWAVSSLTSKFYKTSLNKPSNVESVNPKITKSTSSESKSGDAVSTKKSQANEEGHSDSDYEATNDWSEDWGSIQAESSLKNSTFAAIDDSPAATDGWDDSGWDVGVNTVEISSTNDSSSYQSDQQKTNIDQDDFVPTERGAALTSTYDWSNNQENPDSDSFFTSINSSNLNKTSQSSQSSSWSDWNLNNSRNENTSTSKDVEEARKVREERKLQRQKELKEKRAARQGAMKLGNKQS